MLLQMASQHDGIEDLLGTLFGFLHRRTDFYVECPDQRSASMGFQTGAAEAMLLRSFRALPMKRMPPGAAAAEGKLQPKQQRQPPQNQPKKKKAAPCAGSGQPAASASAASHTPAAAAAAAVAAAPPPPRAAIELTKDGKQVPTGNGGITERYYWTQSLQEVTVVFQLPKGVRSKAVDCAIKHSGLRVGLKNAAEPLLDGRLPEGVQVDDCFW